VFTPAPANAQETLKSEAEEPKDLSLKWWPVWAGISRSGDLGFTTGPYTARDGKSFGHYFTVWKKQNDGTWKWIFDGGVRNDAASPNGPTTEPTHLQLASGAYNYPEAAWGQVAAIEDELAKESAGDAKAALLKHLAEDAHIMSSREQPAVGAAAIAAELDRRAKTIAFKRLGGATSKQGDMIFTYGDAEWAEGADKRQGHYVRIWQKRTAGWRIVFDEIVANPKVQ
jgi:ketosteroid isomerase-like protein